MAKKKIPTSDNSIIHLLDKTIGMEDNVDLLMCGMKSGEIGPKHYVVDPMHDNMPPICEKADKEGRMCPMCKLGVTFYAKGVHKGEVGMKLQFLKDMMGVMGATDKAGATKLHDAAVEFGRSKMNH